MFPQALAYWPGVLQIESFGGSFGQGVTPSVFRMDIVPQSLGTIRQYGDLVMQYGNQATTFRNCSVDSAASSFNESGEVTSLMIRDFRWAWEFATVSGCYNVRNAKGDVVDIPGIAATNAVAHGKRSARKLAGMCLDAMGVPKRKGEVSAVPDDQYPTVDWDVANAARELDALLQLFDLRIAPSPDGTVWVVRTGVGRSLPDGAKEVVSNELDPPERPKVLKGYAGRTRYQADLELEYVGQDVDGTIKLLDDLSYAPDDWLKTDPDDLTEIDDEKIRELARRSVFRMLRIKVPSKVSNYHDGPIETIEQLLPLENIQVDQTVLTATGDVFARPAIVWGKYNQESDIADGNSFATFAEIKPDKVQVVGEDDTKAVVPFGFSIDQDRGLVIFSQPILALDDDDLPDYATLRLRCAFSIRSATTGAYHRATRTATVDPLSPAPEGALVVPDLVLSYGSASNNLEEIKNLMAKAMQDAIDAMSPRPSYTAIYAGWLRIDLDGAIRTVQWSSNASGATTTIQYNTDNGNERAVSYRQRQRIAATRRLLDEKVRNLAAFPAPIGNARRVMAAR